MPMIESINELPKNQDFRLCYSDMCGTYHIAKFSPVKGWTDIDGDSLRVVSHWSTDSLDLPFPNKRKLDLELAKKYGYTSSSLSDEEFMSLSTEERERKIEEKLENFPDFLKNPLKQLFGKLKELKKGIQDSEA